MFDCDFSRGLSYHGANFGFRQLRHLQRKSDIFVHGHVRIKGVALKYHGDVAIPRIGGRDVLPVNKHASRGRRVEAGKDSQCRALAGAGRTEQRKKFAGRDVERHALQRGEIAVHPDDVLETHLAAAAHRRPPPLTAPTVNPLTMFFCATMPRMTTGSIASTETAASLAHSVCSTETKLNMATVTGRTVLPLSTTANRNSFHALRNTNTIVTAMPPRTCGMMIRHKVRNRLAPSDRKSTRL